LPAFLLVVERGQAVLVPEMRFEPARPPVPALRQHPGGERSLLRPRAGGGDRVPLGQVAGAQVRGRGAGWQLLAARLGKRMWREVGGRERIERKGREKEWRRLGRGSRVAADRVGGMAGFMGPGGPAS
jgi:hypothetical protein